MRISELLFLISFFSAIAGYSQEKTVTIKKTIGFGKEVYHVRNKKDNIKQGPCSYKYFNDVHIEGQYVNNSKQGNWQYAIGDNFKINGFFNKGEKDSVWTYFENNKLKTEIHYKNGRRNGIATGYEEGKIQSIMSYKNGKIDGVKKVFYENGNTKFEIEFKNDTVDGDLKYYDIEGKMILHLIYKNNRPFSLEKTEMPDSIKYFSGNLKDGTGTICIYSKKIDNDSIFLHSVQEYSNGFLDGRCTEYGDNGKIKFNGNYKHNCMIGQWNFYNPNDPKAHAYKVYSLKDSIRKDSTDLYQVELTNMSFLKYDTPKFYIKEGFRDFVSRSLQYPISAARNGITGRVYVQFVVDVTGEINNVKSIKNASDDLKGEAVRVIETSPNWIPGFVDNIPCNVSYTFPITFALR